MDLVQKASKLGYKHYTELTLERIDKLPITNYSKQIEYYFIQKWLREEYEIHIELYRMVNHFKLRVVQVYYDNIDGDIITRHKYPYTFTFTKGSYEQALEKGLQEALKLI